MPGHRPRHLRAVTHQEITRYRVRLTVPRASGWPEWESVRSDFEERLVTQADPAVTGPHIDSGRRRGRAYVAVTVSMSVSAPDVAQALAAGWEAFRQAAGDDTAGWDMAWATAEIRPEARLGPPEIARSTAATYDRPAGKSRSSEVCEMNTRHPAPSPGPAEPANRTNPHHR